MAYTASSFTAGQQPTTAQWNQLWSNDASFNDGTGIAAGAITPSLRSGGFKVGSFTTPVGIGNYSVTGVGFTPKLVKFIYLPTASSITASVGGGAMTSTSQFWYSQAATTSACSRNAGTDGCYGTVSSTSSTPSVKASYVSMDADGFTINFSVVSSIVIGWEAYA